MLERLPVVVGVGQIVDRGDDLDAKREPILLVRDAARVALQDARVAGLADRIESVRVVNMLSGGAYRDPAGALAAALDLPAGERLYTTIGGNSPQWLVNRTADDLAAGRLRVALLAGGEALHTLRLASQRRVSLPWMLGSGRPAMIGDDRQGSHADEWRFGLQMPTQIYPLFEVALRAHSGRTPAAHRALLARLSASFAAVAVTHPQAWFRDGKSAEAIVTPTPVNRMIAHPYPKYMTAVMEVDQAAAVIMTTAGEARSLGIPPSRCIHLHGGAEAHDLWYVKDRVDYYSSPGMAAAFRATLEQAVLEPATIEDIDLYSCFPAATQIAAGILGLPSDGSRTLTVTGGLPYFGGAGNNYAMHAIATMVERLRRKPESVGLVSGLGWYMTKHAVGVYGMQPPDRPWRRAAVDQQAIEALPHPGFVGEATGPGRIETFAMLYDRESAPREAILVVRCDDGRRTFALLAPDADLFERFEQQEMVGERGTLRSHPDGRNRFHLTSS